MAVFKQVPASASAFTLAFTNDEKRPVKATVLTTDGLNNYVSLASSATPPSDGSAFIREGITSPITFEVLAGESVYSKGDGFSVILG
ncbi:hypothetical protein SEA_DANZINA_3 [Streptomyces phage Danzina]|uniref:Uncharacterized protein n=1 Tax=Streptomyces phage Danzina TaxID=1690427 RepID=A0A0K1Y967_9CAUD|nr:hypothetical protein FDG70_gp03 [Streptomyces phage Danzina]AKY03458.1 hypothetical protein SEA_DANZINA_3 [Streptomyces phage Danzina]